MRTVNIKSEQSARAARDPVVVELGLIGAMRLLKMRYLQNCMYASTCPDVRATQEQVEVTSPLLPGGWMAKGKKEL